MGSGGTTILIRHAERQPPDEGAEGAPDQGFRVESTPVSPTIGGMRPNGSRRPVRLVLQHVLPAMVAATALLLTGCTAGSSAPAPTPTATPAVAVVKDLVFAAPGGTQLRLDACTPKGTTGTLPAVVIVHSGSFIEGEHGDLDWLCKEGAQHGFAAFTVDYRLLPAAHFPGQLDDVMSAVDWISAAPQVARFHVDPKRVALLGTSAGAIISSELLFGVPGSPAKPSRFVGGALLSAAYDMPAAAAEGPDATPEAVKVALEYAGCSTADCPALRTISAIHAVDRTDPPLFMANSTNELIPLPQLTEMDKALKAAGVQHESHIAQGTDHAEFIVKNHPDIDAAMWAFLTRIAR
jgi:acetyl esterase/lipase